MTADRQKKLMTILITVTLAAVIIILTLGIAAKDKDYQPSTWVLRSYQGTVALYNGDEIEEVYGDISLDTLPSEDIRLLERGIAFPTKEEAVKAIEDYDG